MITPCTIHLGLLNPHPQRATCISLKVCLSISEGAKTEERAFKATDLVLIFMFLHKETGPYVNCEGLRAVLAHSRATVQQQSLWLCGAWGRRQEEAKLLRFHLLCSTYKNVLEIVIIPASKLSPWFAERTQLYCCMNNRTLGTILFTDPG